MTDLRNTCKDSNEYIKKLVVEYKENHIKLQERELLVGENNIEKRDIKGYHGREILELLQNADDAYQKSIKEGNKPNKPLEVCISYKNNIFSICNTGTVFDKEGMKAIVQGNNSPKDGKYFGNKGTGFRSILNWAKNVKILSGGFNVLFSKQIADDFFESIKKEEQIIKQLKKKKPLYVPMLAVPKIIENSTYNDSTMIEIEIDEKKQKDDFSVSKQLESIDIRILLFLPNISKISINTDNKNIIYKRSNLSLDKTTNELNLSDYKIKNLKKIKVEKYVNNNSEPIISEIFFVFDKIVPKKIEEDKVLKDILLSVAIPENYNDFTPKHIYCFFPLLDTESPFNCVLHASYDLNDSRNSINYGDKNTIIIKEQLLFLIEIAKFYIESNNFETAYRILAPISYTSFSINFPNVYAKFKLEAFYLKSLSKERIFKTVNNEFISIDDEPKVFDNGFPDFFYGKGLEKLIVINAKNDIFNFFKLLVHTKNKDCYYDENTLVGIINKLSENWTVQKQITTFIWWNQSRYTNSLPNLIRTQNGDFIGLNNKCYFLIGDFDNIELPKWVKVPSLKKEYQEELFLQAASIEKVNELKEINKEDHISRIISQHSLFPNVDFTYRDRSNIITAVNSSVSNATQAIEFVKWLWDNYHNDVDWLPPGRQNTSKEKKEATIKYNFPDKKMKEIKESDFLFFGKDYGNTLSEELFDERYSSLPPLANFSIDFSVLNGFKSFMRKFGVKDFPVIEKMKIEPIEAFAQKYKQLVKRKGNLGSSTSIYYKWEWPYLKNLENLIQTLSEVDIIRWISNDNALYTNLSNPYCNTSDVTLEYEGNLQQYYRQYRFEYDEKIDNYILFLFNEIPWVEINKRKYSPKHILQYFKEEKTNNNKFADLLPVLTTEKIQRVAKTLELSFDKTIEIYSLFAFCDEVTDLSSNDFYELLLKIPKIQNFIHSEKLSRIIYRILERPGKISFDESNNKREFLENGKVLVKNNGILQYYDAKESYIPSTNILNKRKTPIVEKGNRTNSNNFIGILGCKEYKKEYKIITDSEIYSPLNSDFQIYFKEFREYAKAYKEVNANIAKTINMLTIKIVSNIKIVEIEENIKKEIVVSEDYVFLKSSLSKWFIVLSKETSFNAEINAISELIELIFDNIANTSGFESVKLGELFRSKSKEDREFLIKKEFGSLSIIDHDNLKTEIKTSFESALKELAPSYNLSEKDIDFENFFDNENFRKIIKLFTNLHFDIEDFSLAGFIYPIDLIPYFREKASTFIQNEKRHFKNVLFFLAKTDVRLQDNFIRNYHLFENFSLKEYKNSVYFVPEDIIIDHFSKIINNWHDKKIRADLDSEREYSINYELLNPNNEFGDAIANDVDAQRMIYFKREDDFSVWLERQRQILEYQNKKQYNDVYAEKRNSIPNKKEINFQKNNEKNSHISAQQNSDDTKFPIERTYTKNDIDEKNEHLKGIGNTGELVIYNYLCKEYGKENVFPRSEAFVTLGILKAGQARSSKYDLSYKTQDGVEYFVEVKAGHRNKFFISPEELDFAKNNSKHYKLFYVFNLNKNEPDCYELPSNFWEDERFKKNEIIEKIEYTF